MKKTKTALEESPIWNQVWKEYYKRADEIQEDHDTKCAHQVAMLVYNIEQAVNYLIEYNEKLETNREDNN
jgi:hypothetical protein